MRGFETWDTQDLEITFGIKRNFKSALLEDWLSSESTFEESVIVRLERLREKYFQFSDYWNEDELKMQGISPILDIVDYSSDTYTIFSQRPLSAVINGIEIGGRVDFMLAKGQQKPIEPYFFIHEYKQERKRDSDPKGQLLAELLAAQNRNEKKFPLYGCYVLGRNWFFVVLENNEYSVSNAFNSSDGDIFKIVSILKKVKDYIAENV